MKTIAAMIVCAAGTATAQTTEFNFQGAGGFGLLPGNAVPGAPGSMASGGEAGGGLVFDASDNTLSFDFQFSGLSGGLADVASGIHFHVITDGGDPFSSTGGIAFNLNSGSDANVMLTTDTIAFGSTSGRLAGVAQFDPANVDSLFAGNYYLNIHTGDFGSGEIRGNLVPVPAPATAGLLGLAGAAGLRRRR